MIDIRLNEGHDFFFDGKDFQLVTKSPAVGQRIKIRLLTILVEYKWNFLIGIDWFGDIFSTTTSYTQKNGTLRKVIGRTAGVDTLKTFKFGVDRQNRTARLVFVANTIYDDTVSGYISQISEQSGG